MQVVIDCLRGEAARPCRAEGRSLAPVGVSSGFKDDETARAVPR